jgi:hypothetical protein
MIVANNNQVVNTLGDDVFIFVLNPMFHPAVRHYYLIKTGEIQLFFNFFIIKPLWLHFISINGTITKHNKNKEETC